MPFELRDPATGKVKKSVWIGGVALTLGILWIAGKLGSGTNANGQSSGLTDNLGSLNSGLGDILNGGGGTGGGGSGGGGGGGTTNPPYTPPPTGGGGGGGGNGGGNNGNGNGGGSYTPPPSGTGSNPTYTPPSNPYSPSSNSFTSFLGTSNISPTVGIAPSSSPSGGPVPNYSVENYVPTFDELIAAPPRTLYTNYAVEGYVPTTDEYLSGVIAPAPVAEPSYIPFEEAITIQPAYNEPTYVAPVYVAPKPTYVAPAPAPAPTPTVSIINDTAGSYSYSPGSIMGV